MKISPWDPLIFGARHGQVFLLFTTFFVFFTIRQNLTIAIISMTDTSSPSGNFEVFNWTSGERGVLLGTFFYGYILSNPFSGVMSNRLQKRYLLTFSCFASGILTLLFPVIASWTGIIGCSILRALLGIFQGPTLPCASEHLAKWSTPMERAQFLAFAYAGIPLGGTFVTLVGGYLAGSSGGWPSVFYVSGAMAMFWGFVMWWLLRDSPKLDERISIEERAFIEGSLGKTADKLHSLPIPWRSILLSFPFWISVVTGLCHNWGLWTIGTMLPTYMKGTFNFNIEENGLYSAIPNIGMFAAGIVGPITSKFVSSRFHLPLTIDRKIWNSLADYGTAISLIIIALAQPASTTVVILLFTAEFCTALSHQGYGCTALDLSPNFAGILMGILNGICQISALLAPTLTGFMLHGNGTPFEWRIVFMLSAGVAAFGGSVFNLFGSAATQPWNFPQ